MKKGHFTRKDAGVFYDGHRITDEELLKSFMAGMDRAEGNEKYAFVVDMRKEKGKDAKNVMNWKKHFLDEDVKIAVMDTEKPDEPVLVGEVSAREYLSHKECSSIKELCEEANIKEVISEDLVFAIDTGKISASWSCVGDAIYNAIEDGDEKGVDIYAGITLGSATNDLTINQFITADDRIIERIDREELMGAVTGNNIEDIKNLAGSGEKDLGIELSPGGIDWRSGE